MPASLCNCLKSDDIIYSGSATIEGREFIPITEDFGKDFARCLARSPAFRHIWIGGPEELHLILRKQIDVDKNGRLMYNGKPYNKDTWCCYYIGDCELYGPPKVIRQMGRVAKEVHNPANNNPEISILTEKGYALRLDACPCGGELLMDHRGDLYCSNCYRIYE